MSSYFHGAHNAKTEAMVAKVEDFDVIVASSEFEALVLENSLIKHHMPHYNILLKDDKGYPFIRVDMREPYPSFSVVNRMGNNIIVNVKEARIAISEGMANKIMV